MIALLIAVAALVTPRLTATQLDKALDSDAVEGAYHSIRAIQQKYEASFSRQNACDDEEVAGNIASNYRKAELAGVVKLYDVIKTGQLYTLSSEDNKVLELRAMKWDDEVRHWRLQCGV